MSDGLQQYPEYKDSRVDWLGDVPAHWNVVPLFGEFEEKQVKNTGLIENTVLSLSYGRIIVKPLEKLHGLVPESFETYQIVDPGDIIIRPTDLQNDHTSLRIGFSQNQGIITSAYICLRTWNDLSPEYGYHVLNVFDLTKAIYGYGSGLRQNLSFAHIKRVGVPVPPPDEQDAIVRFLDVAEKRIRRYIRAKQKLIKLLNEQKQAIIQQAVTRGLNPDAPMKDSGVEWLSEIPEHWDLLPVRRLISFLTSGSRGWAKYYADFGDIFVQSGNIGRTMKLDFTRQFFVNPPAGSEGERTRLIQDDVVVCVTGALTGNVAHVHEILSTAYVNQHVALLRPKKSVVYPRFLAYVLHSVIGQIQFKLQEYGGTKQGLSLTDVREVIVPTPPFIEQKNIVTDLDLNTSQIVKGIENIQREIDCIREYRTRLIADVVTGKVDVRGLAFEMLEAFDDDDLLDVDEDELLEDDEDVELETDE